MPQIEQVDRTFGQCDYAFSGGITWIILKKNVVCMDIHVRQNVPYIETVDI